MSDFEVDQSGKMGDTRTRTVLALSDDISHTILIPARAKRECLEWLRARERLSPVSYLKLFAAGLFLLIENHLDRIEYLIIDEEYPGHAGTIRGMLLHHIQKVSPSFESDRILFARIGKKSRAHARAYEVYRKDVAPDRQIRTRELITLLRK